jgi:hypothetical protein
MSAIIQFVPAADLSFLTTDNKVSAFPHREPEQRLWKLFSQTVSPKLAMIELFVFMLFVVVTVIGIVSCFAELSSLLQSGAINHLTVEALNGGAQSGLLSLPQRRTVGDACLSRRPFGRRQEDLRSNGDRAGSGSASDTRLSNNLSKKPSRSVAIRNKAIEVLRRQPDGTWKLIVGDPNGRE